MAKPHTKLSTECSNFVASHTMKLSFGYVAHLIRTCCTFEGQLLTPSWGWDTSLSPSAHSVSPIHYIGEVDFWIKNKISPQPDGVKSCPLNIIHSYNRSELCFKRSFQLSLEIEISQIRIEIRVFTKNLGQLSRFGGAWVSWQGVGWSTCASQAVLYDMWGAHISSFGRVASLKRNCGEL